MYDNPVLVETLLTGFAALILWAFIWYRSMRGSLGWAGPTNLFAMGLLILYIVPTLYWQVRPWNYFIPPYYRGLPIVMSGAMVLGIPFLINSLRRLEKRKMLQDIFPRRHGTYGPLLWLALIPVISGMAYRLYLFTLGFQGRNIREIPLVLGSESLALIVYNLTIIFPIFYYPLIGFGNRLQRRIGYLFWIIDGLLQLSTLHRWAILLFILRSAVFAVLLGWRLKRRHWIAIGFACVLTISVIGEAGLLSRDIAKIEGTPSIGLKQVLPIITESITYYVHGSSSSSGAGLVPILDDVMFRLFLARSASAVMYSTPEFIPYFYGETFIHVLYAWIPRFFFPGKPDLGSIHLLTTRVMPGDMGVNPTGTIAELYINYGFLAIFLGGMLCLIICRWQETTLLHGRSTEPIWFCIYPVLSMWYFWADANLSQRLAEGLRFLLIFGVVWLLLWISRVKRRP